MILPQRVDRQALVRRLSHESFDVVVIGGGITGAWIALDASMRGLSVALVERGDFASGTSSRSSRFVHGGLRYLRHRHFSLVRESLRERGLLLRIAPHLVRPFPFLLLSHEGGRDSALLLRVGITGYDLLAGRQAIKRNQALSRNEVLHDEPRLQPEGLLGGIRYYDAVTDDARLTLAVILAAVERGAAAVNYVEAVSLETARGRVTGVNCRDTRSRAEYAVASRVVVSAAGPWTDELRALGGMPGILRPTKGVHIVVPHNKLPTDSIVAFHWRGRDLFVVPAGRRAYIGTTDTDWQGEPDSAVADAGDVAYLLEATNACFDCALTPSDVNATWAGVRPLIADEGAPSPSDVSRDYEIVEGPPGLYAITGGKLTTARSMAQALVDRLVEQHGRHFTAIARRCRTDRALLPGAVPAFRRYRRQATADLATGWGMPDDTAAHLVDTYGTSHVRVLGCAGGDRSLVAPVADGRPELLAEAAYAATHEMAITLEDFMRRRSNLMMFGPSLAAATTSNIARVMGEALGWDETEERRQIDDYGRDVQRMTAFPTDVLEGLVAGS